MADLTESTFAAWLDRYKAAWEEGDPGAAAALFSVDAVNVETSFDEPLRGREAIRAYRNEGAALAQRDVRFSYEIAAVVGDVGLSQWHCVFTRVASGETVELDGTFRCTFDDDGLCSRFQEWWHRRTIGALPR